ncbi:MAG: hypothetical protein CMJ26_06750 [Phycisphaerae bacterium]|nr:hypothetical protein [Phycisphaerae bacterium]
MSRKKGPALYELISTNKPPRQSREKRSMSNEETPDVHLEHNVLTPGRSIRVSIGTIGVIVAVSIALIVISYTMGFRRGSDIAREDYGNRLFEEVTTTQLTEAEPMGNRVLTPVRAPNTPLATKVPARWGPIISDPRVKGTNYFTLIQTSKDGAVQLASFCREKGLETYAFSGDNTRLYRVIAFPGSVDRNDAVAKDVQARIYAIGAEWANTKEGRTSDLKDAYQSLYK